MCDVILLKLAHERDRASKRKRKRDEIQRKIEIGDRKTNNKRGDKEK